MEKFEEKGMTPLVAELVQTPVINKRRKEELALQNRRKQNAYQKMVLYAPEAVETLVDIMRLGSNSDRLKAAVKILEYTVGKPSENKQMEELKETVLSPEEYEDMITGDNEEELQLLIEEGYQHGK